MRILAPFCRGKSCAFFGGVGVAIVSNLGSLLRADLLVASKIIRTEIYRSYQTGMSVGQVVMETTISRRLYCHFVITLQRILLKYDIKNRTVIVTSR